MDGLPGGFNRWHEKLLRCDAVPAHRSSDPWFDDNSQFGRRPRQNQSNGTDHGTAAPHFIASGAVRGGLYGQPADLSRLDSAQNLLFTTDSRQLYAAIARDWWGVNPETVVRGRFEPVRFLKT